MSEERKITNITDFQLKQRGVQALADRPNAAQQYGQSGLSATQLKQWFDKLAELLAEKLNTLQDVIQSIEGAEYIGIALKDYSNLASLITAMQNGEFADKILALQEIPTSEKDTLQQIIYSLSEKISKNAEDIDLLFEDKLDKVTETATHKRIYGVDNKGEQVMLDATASPTGQVPLYSTNGALIARMTPIEGMPGGEYPSEVVNMAFMNELRKHIGAGVKFSMDPTTYIVSIDVVNIDGQVIYHTELDLPLESVVVGGYYDDKTKEVVFTLKSGEEIRFPVEKLVNGLVTEAQHSADIKAVNDKFDALFNAYVADVYQIVGGDYVDYS